MPWIAFFTLHLAGFSWSEICVGLLNWRAFEIIAFIPFVHTEHWTWTGHEGRGVPWVRNYLEYPLTGLLSCYGYYWILKRRSEAGRAAKDTIVWQRVMYVCSWDLR